MASTPLPAVTSRHGGDKVGGAVIDRAFCAESMQALALGLAACGGEGRGRHGRAASWIGVVPMRGAAVDQEALAGRKAAEVEDVAPHGEEGLAETGGFFQWETGWHRQVRPRV